MFHRPKPNLSSKRSTGTGETASEGDSADTGSTELKRQLSFRDVFFLSFGGESPLLSLLTYGAVALSLGGYLAPVVLLLGAGIVLVNGFVVHRLSARYTTSGGYYTYAVQSLSERTGFQTGWMYLFYSILFGSAYIVGAAYVINYVFGIDPVLVALAMTLPAFLFLLIGIKPSAKYAVIAGIVEMAAMIIFFFYAVYLAHFTLYSPLTYRSSTSISAGNLAFAVLFAMGIPSGYGAVAPISGEVVNAKKVVGRVAVSVILVGGALAALFIYGITDLLVSKGVGIRLSTSGGGLALLGLVSTYFGGAGKYFVYMLAIGAISDGILAILSYCSAASRTIFRMGVDRTLPGLFAEITKGQPLNANITIGFLVIAICTVVLIQFPPVLAFVALGTISIFGGLFIHLAANFSLLRIGMRRARRRLTVRVHSLYSIFRRYDEALLALTAVVVTSLEFVLSLSSPHHLVYFVIFLAWIVVGYLVSDIKEILFKTPSDHLRTMKNGSAGSSLADSPELSAMDIRGELPDVIVRDTDPVKAALKICLDTDAPGAVVVDMRGRPVGTVLLRDITSLSSDELDTYLVEDIALPAISTVTGNERALELTGIFRESGLPILAIVDFRGRVVGTIREREIIRKLALIYDSQFAYAPEP